jgi:hypothetical protein
MRSVLSISIPPEKLKILKKKAKKEGMTVTAYVVGRIDEDLEADISEKKLLQYWKEAREDLKQGRVKEWKHPDDLLRKK